MTQNTFPAKTFGSRLLHLRKNSALTLQALAESTGISRSNLNKYEKDEIRPTSDAIVALAKYFQTSTDWLLTGAPLAPELDSALSDSDFKKMLEVLKVLMTSEKEHLRSWTIIQFESAFQTQYDSLKK